MSGRLKKIVMLLLAAVLLVGVAQIQRALNRDRLKLGLTRVEPLENAPPVLAFTTVALGGFRGLIANALWIRAIELQDEDKFFEMAQLADWITKLEPHYTQVWLVQGWNMAYNISVKFKDFQDRWRWVRRGISLLRDDGLRFNPNDVLIHRELAWFFQHKMGQNLDDANVTYKQEWMKEMQRVFGREGRPDFDALIRPADEDAVRRLTILTNEFKMRPDFMKAVDARYGPLEWRLPEAHAIYWAAQGLERAQEHPDKIKPDDLIQLRRVIYQSMQLSFQRGRLIWDPIQKGFDTGPNLEVIPKVSAAYEQAMEEDAPNRDHIQTAHRNFLRDAVYYLFEHNRIPEAAQWYQLMCDHYPNKPLLETVPDSYPRTLTLQEYCIARICEDVSETSRDRVKKSVEALVMNSYLALIRGESQKAAGFKALARILQAKYMEKIAGGANAERIGIPTVEITERELQALLLDPQKGWPAEMRTALRAALGLPAETVAPPTGATTNAPPAEAATP
jgi:hypothetical protein